MSPSQGLPKTEINKSKIRFNKSFTNKRQKISKVVESPTVRPSNNTKTTRNNQSNNNPSIKPFNNIDPVGVRNFALKRNQHPDIPTNNSNQTEKSTKMNDKSNKIEDLYSLDNWPRDRKTLLMNLGAKGLTAQLRLTSLVRY